MTGALGLAFVADAAIAAGAVLTLALLRDARPALKVAYIDAVLAIMVIVPILRLGHVGVDLALPGTVSQPMQADVPSSIILWLIYLTGVALGLLGLLRGTCSLIGISRRADPVGDAGWRRANCDLSTGRPPELRSSAEVPSAMSWGFGPGMIMLDTATLVDRTNMRAVLAHEQAHLRRGDWPLLIFGRIVLALNWYDPLVWLLVAERCRSAEEAADAMALRHVAPCDYAQALLSAARCRTRLPVTSLTGAGLRTRVSKVLAPQQIRSAGASRAWLSAGLLVLIAMLNPAVPMPEAAGQGSQVLPSRQATSEYDRVPVPMSIPVPVPVPIPMDGP